MKHPYIVLVLFLIFYTSTAQVGIGTTSPNAQLDIKSSNQAAPANNDGILIPKVDTFSMVNPTALQDGMMVYLTTTAGPNQPGFYYWENATTSWRSVGGDKGWGLNGNTGTTPISNAFALLNENFIGTSDATDLSVGANKMEYFRLKSGIDNIGFFNKNPDYNLDLQTSITGITQPRNGLRIKDIVLGSGAQRGSFFGFDHNNLNETLVWTYGDNEYYINDKSIRLGIGNEAVNQTLAKFTYHSIGLFGDNPNYTFDIKTAPNDAVFHNTRRNGIRINTPFSNSNNDLAGLFIGIKDNGNFQDANESYIWNYGDGVATTSFISFGAGPDISTGEIMRVFKDKIGIGTTTPTNSAIVDINSSDMGVLFPRVHLTDVTTAGPILVLTNSLLVYNNNPFIIGGDGEGYYYWNGTKWIKLLTDNNNKWSITGNSGTNSSTHFIGTTDDNDLVFKRNNILAGKIGATNTSFGYYAAASITGDGNSSFGTYALGDASTGSYNTANGWLSLRFNEADNNTAFGASTLTNNHSGSSNVGIGNNALYNNNSGNNNIAIGKDALISNFGGNDKIAIGFSALYNNSIGSGNVAIGSNSQYWNATGSYNTSVGFQSLLNLNNGEGNSAFGYSTLEAGFMSNYNTAIGFQSLKLTQQNQNTAVGYNTVSQCMNCSNNTAVGYKSQFSVFNGSNNVSMGSETLLMNNGSYLTAIGTNALRQNESGNSNTAVGYESLSSNSNGNNNTATGYQSLYGQNGGDGNSAFGYYAMRAANNGSNNTATGYQSLFFNQSNNNTANGYNSLLNNLNGTGNTAMGYQSLYSSTFGSYNTAIGFESLLLDSGNVGATAIGSYSLRQNIGSGNTATGYESLRQNTIGTNNTANGYQTLKNQTTGNSNVAFGNNALFSNTTGSFNTANGSNALYSNLVGTGNTAIGFESLFSNINDWNTAIGHQALYTNTYGLGNVALGYNSLRSNTMGVWNTANGYNSMYANTTGYQNTANGVSSLTNNSTGNYNTANGSDTLYSNYNGDRNTANGAQALFSNQTGNFNTALGSVALSNNTTGNENTGIGYHAIAAQTYLTNATAIGANSYVSTSNSLVLGSVNGLNGATNDVNVGIGTTSPSNKLHVVGNIRMVDGNQSAGKVLTSDINGVGTWQTPSTASYWTRSGLGQIYPNTLTDNIGIGTNAPNAPLQFSNAVANRKIVLYDTNNNDNQYYGFGINGGTLRYQTDATGADHVFFAGVNSTTSNELMRIKGTGNVGIGTNNPTTKLEINGYTKLGSDAPAIRVIKLTGTTSNVQNGTVTIPHGLNPAKILSATVLVEYFTNSFVPASYSRTGYEFDFYITGANIYIWNSAANSGSILSKPIKIMITYEE